MSSNPSIARTSRRRLIGTGSLGAASLAALGIAGAVPRIAAAQTAPTQTGPWLGGDVPAASRTSRQMAAAARVFLNALSADQLSIVQYADLSDPARTQWTNFPAGAVARPGAALGDLSDEQRVLLHNLLRASTSSQGYHKMALAIHADQVLNQIENGDPLFGSANFYTTVFGNPEDVNWAWMITGHHMSALFTAAADRTAFTPMFTGAQPLMVPSGLDAGLHVLPQDAGRAIELFSTLSSDQQSVAILGSTPPGDLFAGPSRQNALTTFQGVPSAQLSDQQQRLLWLLVEEFVHNADSDAADAQLTLVQNSWADLHFAWQGPPPSDDVSYYFRVHGPRILIEYDVQEPLTSNGGHVHALTRDPVNDYGMDWLGIHYLESAPQFSPGITGAGGGPGGGPGGAPPAGAANGTAPADDTAAP